MAAFSASWQAIDSLYFERSMNYYYLFYLQKKELPLFSGTPPTRAVLRYRQSVQRCPPRAGTTLGPAGTKGQGRTGLYEWTSSSRKQRLPARAHFNKL